MISFAGFATKGIEDVVVGELVATVPNCEIGVTRPKVVPFRTAFDVEKLQALRCPDDIVMEVASYANGASVVEEEIARGFARVRSTLAQSRSIGEDMSITVSAIRRNHTEVAFLEEQIVRLANLSTHVKLRSELRTEFDVRLHIDGDFVLVGVRVFADPLARLRRPANVVHRQGGLRPTIAAAMVRLATEGFGDETGIIDPFCGSGTILNEALDAGYAAWGSDIDPEAVVAAQQNLAARGHNGSARVTAGNVLTPDFWDRWPSGACLVTNLPWNKQIAVDKRTPLYRSVGYGMARCCREGRSAVVLTTDPNPVIAAARRNGLNQGIKQRRLGYGGHTPTLLCARAPT